jgi:hypothetical protein
MRSLRKAPVEDSAEVSAEGMDKDPRKTLKQPVPRTKGQVNAVAAAVVLGRDKAAAPRLAQRSTARPKAEAEAKVFAAAAA